MLLNWTQSHCTTHYGEKGWWGWDVEGIKKKYERKREGDKGKKEKTVRD